jgi:hypothetical protein
MPTSGAGASSSSACSTVPQGRRPGRYREHNLMFGLERTATHPAAASIPAAGPAQPAAPRFLRNTALGCGVSGAAKAAGDAPDRVRPRAVAASRSRFRDRAARRFSYRPMAARARRLRLRVPGALPDRDAQPTAPCRKPSRSRSSATRGRRQRSAPRASRCSLGYDRIRASTTGSSTATTPSRDEYFPEGSLRDYMQLAVRPPRTTSGACWPTCSRRSTRPIAALPPRHQAGQRAARRPRWFRADDFGVSQASRVDAGCSPSRRHARLPGAQSAPRARRVRPATDLWGRRDGLGLRRGHQPADHESRSQRSRRRSRPARL